MKIKLSFWQIWKRNIGFLGIQYSFGLQQTAINSIFLFLGASEEMLPILNIAGPVTGLLVQPIVELFLIRRGIRNGGEENRFF